MIQASAAPPESVHVLRDPASGLDGVIVLHSTRRGPAAGGCRLWRYSDSAEMAQDAARLAEGMAYKNALAGPAAGGRQGRAQPSAPSRSTAAACSTPSGARSPGSTAPM